MATERAHSTTTTTTTLTSSTSTVAGLIPRNRKYSSSRPRPSRRTSSPSSQLAPAPTSLRSPTNPLDVLDTTPATLSSSRATPRRRRRITETVPIPPRPVETDVRPQSSSSALSQVLSPKDLSPAASYFALRPSSPGGNELRSPLISKRPPASRSSHGIETATGPPPALSTQRSFSIDSWRLVTAEVSSPKSPDLTPRAPARLDAGNRKTQNQVHAVNGAYIDLAEEECIEIHDPDIVPSIESEHSGAMSTTTTAIPRHGGDAASKRLSGRFDESRHTRKDSESSNEDLFFDIANGEDTAETVTGRRSSRIALPSHRHVKSQPNPASPATQLRNEEQVRSSPLIRERRGSLRQSEHNTQIRTPSSLGQTSPRDRSYAASAHPLDARPFEQRFRSRLSSGNPKPVLNATRGLQSRERSPESPSYIVARRQSVTDTPSNRFRNNIQFAGNGTYHSSPLNNRHEQYAAEPSPPGGRDGTESTVSTTAPSTVWDELDDLKSRIKKLELTGKLPPSSGAAVTGFSERPRTATTTVTTMSSSPKRAQGQSISPTSNLEADSDLHPLLRSALTKSQSLLSGEIYHSLEATAHDALTLAKLASTTNPQTTTNVTVDRQLKRIADSLCRSLTELCIALSENKAPTDGTPTEKPSTRPGSRDASRSRPRSIILDEPRYQRAPSQDPEPSSARVLSRLEARRLSLMSGATVQPSPPSNLNNSNTDSPAAPPQQPYGVKMDGYRSEREPSRDREPPTPTQSTLARTSTVLQRIRGSEESDNTIRPLSRAMTELNRRPRASGPATSAAEKRRSREYTSNYPLPMYANPENWTAREPTVTALPVRRTYYGGKNEGSPLAQGLGQQSQPGTPGTPPTTVGAAENTTGRFARRNYLDRSSAVGTAAVENQSPSNPAENRQKRLSSLGLGGLIGRKTQGA